VSILTIKNASKMRERMERYKNIFKERLTSGRFWNGGDWKAGKKVRPQRGKDEENPIKEIMKTKIPKVKSVNGRGENERRCDTLRNKFFRENWG